LHGIANPENREFKSHPLFQIGDVGKLVTPVDCKSAASGTAWFDSSRLHQSIRNVAQSG